MSKEIVHNKQRKIHEGELKSLQYLDYHGNICVAFIIKTF